MRRADLAARTGKMRNALKILIGPTKRNRPVGRSSLGWKVDNKIDFYGIQFEDVDMVHLD
jgi:hypothetical protein